LTRPKFSVFPAYPQARSRVHHPVMTRPFSRSTLPLAALSLALMVLVGACTMSSQQRADRDAERCAASGYQPTSDAYADCLTRLGTERDARVQARHREMMEKSVAPPLSPGQ
jgi:hypothetical protein